MRTATSTGSGSWIVNVCTALGEPLRPNRTRALAIAEGENVSSPLWNIRLANEVPGS